MASSEYRITPTGYLLRAKQRILDGTAEALFYAALELRCYVEARQDQYLDAQREYAKSIPKAWRIGAQGKALNAIFASDKIQRLAFVVGHEPAGWLFCHVPVSDPLRKGAERMGELLHAGSKWRPPQDPWWDETRDQIIRTYREAWTCNQGRLVSPLFMHGGDLAGKVAMAYDDEGERDQLQRLMTVGSRGLMHVDYLDAPPPEWVCDI